MKNLILVASIIVFSACSNLPTEPETPRGGGEVREGEVQLRAERTAAGRVLLTLRNNSGATVGYNLCVTAFERRTGEAWENVPSDIVCTMELRTLTTGGSASFVRDIPSGLRAGDYRFVTNVESPIGNAQVRVASNTITLP